MVDDERKVEGSVQHGDRNSAVARVDMVRVQVWFFIYLFIVNFGKKRRWF